MAKSCLDLSLDLLKTSSAHLDKRAPQEGQERGEESHCTKHFLVNVRDAGWISFRRCEMYLHTKKDLVSKHKS